MDARKNLSYMVVSSAILMPTLATAEFPEKPIKLVVASAPGTVADVLARLYADKLKNQVGQPVVVDNKPGATGAIGADIVAKAPGDGYTILLNSSALTINPWIAKQPFNFMKDLTPVARTADTAYIVTVNSQTFQNFEQFLAHAKKSPGKVECATYGIGSPPHLALELFKRAAGVYILHIPYKSSAQALPELLTGQIGCIVEPPPGSQALIKSGRLRVIAHSGSAENGAFPDAAPIGKRFPSATVVGWQAILAPSSTPQPVLDRLRREFELIRADPEVQQKVRESGFQTSTESPEAFSKSIASDYEKFGKIIKEANIKFD